MDQKAGQGSGVVGGQGVRASEPETLHIWRPRPLVRSILWQPSEPDASVTVSYEVFVMQDVLVDVLKRTRADASGGTFGFLVGDLCECPESGVRYALVTSAISARFRFDEQATPQIPVEAYVAMQLKLDRRVGNLVGWFHCHAGAEEVSLSEADIATHLKYFKQGWQSALVLVPRADCPLGGFFRPGPDGEMARQPQAFYEVLSARSFVARGVRQTCVTWQNYRTETQTVPLPGTVGTRAPMATPARAGTRSGEVPNRRSGAASSAGQGSTAQEALRPVAVEPEDGATRSAGAGAATPGMEGRPASDSSPRTRRTGSERLFAPERRVPPSAEQPAARGHGGLTADFRDVGDTGHQAVAKAPASPVAWGSETASVEEARGPAVATPSVSRPGDRQGEAPDPRLAEMHTAYPASTRPDVAPPRQARPNAPPATVAAPRPEPARAGGTAAEPATRERARSRRIAQRSGRHRRRRGVMVTGGAVGIAVLGIAVWFGGHRMSSNLGRQGGENGVSSAVTGGRATGPQTRTEAAAAAAGPGVPTTGSSSTDGAATGTTVPEAGVRAPLGGTRKIANNLPGAVEPQPSPEAAGTGGAPLRVVGAAGTTTDASVTEEVARLAKPIPNQVYAAPVLAVGGTVVELKEGTASAAKDRNAPQGARNSLVRSPPQVAAPVLKPTSVETSEAQISITRPDVLKKLDRLSDTLANALNAYFVGALNHQDAKGSCEDVVGAHDAVQRAWSDYNQALGTPRIVRFEGTRAARDGRLSERVKEAESNFTSSGCAKKK